MKIPETKRIEEARRAFLTAQKEKQIKASYLALLSLFIVFVLPRFVAAPIGPIICSAGGAVLFSIYVL